MKCNEFLEHLSQYVENDLSEDKMRECEAHLFSCEECRGAFEEEKEISRLFLEAMNDDEILFESRIDKVMESIDKEKYSNKKVVSLESKKKKRFLNKKVAGLAAVCAMCLYFAPGIIQSRMYSSDSAMMEKVTYDGLEKDSTRIGMITAEDDENVSKVRSYGVENKSEEEAIESKEPVVNAIYTSESKDEQDDTATLDDGPGEKTADGTKANPTVNTFAVGGNDKSETKTETESNSDAMKDEVPPVKTVINPDKTNYTGATVKGNTAVPGLFDNEKKLNEALDREIYLKENFGIKVIHSEEGSYIDNNGETQTFGFKFGAIENYVEDEDFIYMIYKGNTEKGGELTSKVLKFNKDTKKMESIYEIKSSEVIDSLKIEEDGLVYTIKYGEKTKSVKIEK